MPDTKISALTALAKASIDTAADLVPLVDTSAAETKRATVSDFVKSVFDPAAPGAIGGTTPAAGTFTTLTATDQASFTKDSATGAVNVSPTWNNGATNFNAIYGRVTNTASGASSNLIDLGTVAGGNLFKVDKSGFLYLNGDSSPTIARRTDVNMLMLHVATSGSVGVVGIGTVGYNYGLNISQSAGLAWTNDTPASTRDIILTRASAGVLSLSTGRLRLPNLPTSSAGLSAGDLWNDAGTVKIV